MSEKKEVKKEYRDLLRWVDLVYTNENTLDMIVGTILDRDEDERRCEDVPGWWTEYIYTAPLSQENMIKDIEHERKKSPYRTTCVAVYVVEEGLWSGALANLTVEETAGTCVFYFPPLYSGLEALRKEAYE